MRGWFWCVVAAGCTISAENFPEAAADAYCEKADRCDTLQTSIDACKDATRAIWDGILAVGEGFGGEFDEGAAGACVRGYRSLSCDAVRNGDQVEACDELFVEEE